MGLNIGKAARKRAGAPTRKKTSRVRIKTPRNAVSSSALNGKIVKGIRGHLRRVGGKRPKQGPKNVTVNKRPNLSQAAIKRQRKSPSMKDVLMDAIHDVNKELSEYVSRRYRIEIGRSDVR